MGELLTVVIFKKAVKTNYPQCCFCIGRVDILTKAFLSLFLCFGLLSATVCLLFHSGLLTHPAVSIQPDDCLDQTAGERSHCPPTDQYKHRLKYLKNTFTVQPSGS